MITTFNMSQKRDAVHQQRGALQRSFTLLVFIIASAIICASTNSIAPVLVFTSLWCTGLAILYLCRFQDPEIRRCFSAMFAFGTLAAAITEVYAHQFQSADLINDAYSYYLASTAYYPTETLSELQKLQEGALAIYAWRLTYDAVSMVGGSKAPYVGIGVNTLLVALSAALGMRVVRLMFGDDRGRFKQFLILCVPCALLLLSAGTHLREAFLLLVVCVLMVVWAEWLRTPASCLRAMIAVTGTLLATAAIDHLRNEMLLLPTAVAVSAVSALWGSKWFGAATSRPYGSSTAIAMALVVGGASLATAWQIDVLYLLAKRQAYESMSVDSSAENSLGNWLVVTQPLTIRIPIGFFYILLGPVPFWAPFTVGSAYGLFLGLRGLYFLFVLPLIALTLWQLITHKRARLAIPVFITSVSVGLVLVAVASSMEARHVAVASIGLAVAAVIPDLKIFGTRRRYRNLVLILASAMAVVHLIWLAIKM